jgi:hypothetical protein
MEVRRTALGEGHPDYAGSLNNLALLYYVMGRTSEAQALTEQARKIRGLSQGPDQ